MTIESITDSEWLLQHHPHASEEQEEAYLEIQAVKRVEL